MEYVKDLPENQFTEVWNALGVIARARVRSLKAAQDMAEQSAHRRVKEGRPEAE